MRLVVFPGQGMLFWWQAGALSALRPHVDFAGASMSGASAGACTAALAACGVAGDDALECADELARAARVFERPLGLASVWGGLVREWLNRLLPHDAHARCDGRLHVSLLEVLPWRRRLVCDFASRAALVDAVMASLHVPFFMDGRPFAVHRRRLCLDAGVGASHDHLLPRAALPGLPGAGARDAFAAALRARGLGAASAGGLDAVGAGGVLTLCYSHDAAYAHLRRADLLRLHGRFDGVRSLYDAGADFARREYVPRLHAPDAACVLTAVGNSA
ncbi:hypothetical protein KFE25_005190 [Diacronema lutheri]|uniref:PNPLA domain-containing protein n=2 Tax=Diacronema lutheri TaxID=2081491 RepID=A0A8J5X3C1_DIALT|nr:hypothetical protein KFE25_005190 [Diacronema lutheri]